MTALGEATEELEEEMSDQEVAMQQCMQKVKGRSWDVLQLTYFEDNKSHEVASLLDLSPGNVRVILKRVRDSLKKCIEQRLAGEAS